VRTLQTSEFDKIHDRLGAVAFIVSIYRMVFP